MSWSGFYNYTHLNANATTTVKSGAGALAKVIVNKKGVSSNTLTLYDNTTGSGTVIAVIDTTTAVQSIDYMVEFQTGLTAVLATGTVADVTLVWF